MKFFKSVFRIINYKTFIVTILSIISTWVCFNYQIMADFPLTLVGIAIVFPVVFSIDSAYKRRERALIYLAEMKGHMQALFLASRDWLVNSRESFDDEMKSNLSEIYDLLRGLLMTHNKKQREIELRLNESLSSLSRLTQYFREKGLPGGDISRINQYVSKIAISIENLKAIRNYRTPITLRAYSKVFIFTFPILYAPHFVFEAQHYTRGIEYMMPVVFSFILVSLDNIQMHLENPFDQVGEDDIKFDVEEFSEGLK